MQVITGKIKGRRLKSPESARPTLQRVKVSLFSLLNPYFFEGCRVLDLFSGSGALGIEALSRGASKTIFVDENKVAVKIIRDNLHDVNPSLFEIIQADYLVALKQLKSGGPFDIIFIDPPYKNQILYSAIDIIERYGLISDNGVIVVETEADLGIDLTKNGFVVLKDKTYGTARITLLSKLGTKDQ